MCGKNNKRKPKPSDSSRFELEYINEEAEMETAPLAGFDSTSALVKQRLPHEHLTEGPPGDDLRPVQADSPSHNFDNNFAIVSIREKDQTFRDPSNPDDVPELNAKNEEDADLQEMFYLPKTYSTPLSHSDKPRRHESLKPILANVAELLSRSPPSLDNMLEVETAAPCLPPSPQLRLQPFPISFSLDVDDDDGCDDISAAGRDSDEPVVLKGGSKHREPDSPTWDAVFKDEEVSYENIRNDKKELDSKKGHDPKECVCTENERWDNIRADAEPSTRDAGVMEDGGISNNVQINESMDLFEDDEAFMQMTIPDIPTPQDSVTAETTLNAKHNESTDKMAKSEPTSSTRNPSDCTEILNAAKITQQVGEDNRTPASDARLKLQGSNTRTEGKPQFQKPVDHFTKDDSSFQSLMQENPEPLDSSLDFFSVNFDLGYLLEDSEDETEVEAAPASPSTKKQVESAATLPAVSNSSTPRSSFVRLFRESKLSPPQIKTDYWKSRTEELPSPVTSLGARRTLLSRLVEPPSSSLKWSRTEGNLRVASAEDSSRQGSVHVGDSSPNPAECYSDSEEDVVHHKRRHHKINPLSSPEVSKILSDVDSPVVAKKKRAFVLNTTDETQAGASSDDDFQNNSMFTHRKAQPGAKRQQVQQPKNKNTKGQKARQFLDEEAELSEDEEGADVSSDEEDGADLNRSLEGFVVDNTHLSQGLNDSDMQGVYLKSVRSPAVQGKFKMSYKNHHDTGIFSQVPEMDETYAEDSFLVGSDEEEPESNEEEPEVVELLPEVSYVDGRRQYATRRRVFLHKARAGPETKIRTQSAAEQGAKTKTKLSRVICLNDSSEEETEEASKKGSPFTGGSVAPFQANTPHPNGQKSTTSASATIASKVSLLSKGPRSSLSEEQRSERCRQKLEKQHLLSDELEFAEPESTLITVKELQGLPSTSSAPQKSTAQDPSVNKSPSLPGSVCILVDSRCISGGVELMTSLRQRLGANVHVCSLDSSYFIVSNRMAVERHSQSDLAAMHNRKRLAERLTNLQGLFERVCLIVEKDRSKQGEVSRPFQRTRYYDSTLAALVRAGIRLLWSGGAEESAGLLADLAKLEHRKGQGIAVPLEVKGQHRQQALQLYRSLPSVSHVHALNLLHNFSSVAQLMNSSVEAIQKGGCMSRTRAEEIYRILRHSCDSAFLVNPPKAGKKPLKP